MGRTPEPGSSSDRAAAPSPGLNPRVVGGPPRFFALTVTPRGTLLAGTCGRGTSRSDDGGRTWAPVDGPGNGVVHDFAILPDGRVLASTGGSGMHRSADDGRTWQPLGLDGEILYGLHAGSELLAGTHGSGVARSADGGATWSVDDDPPGVTVYRVLGLDGAGALAATDGRGIWAVTGDGWRQVGLDGLSVYALARLGHGVLLAGTRGRGLIRSVDDGASWEPVHRDEPDADIHTLVLHDGAILAGTGHGIHRSHDRGETWEPVGDGLGSRRIFSIVVAGPQILAGSYDGVWRWPGPKSEWEAVDTGLSPCEAFTIGVGLHDSLLAGTKTGALRSDDGGRSWRGIPPLSGTAVHAVLATSTGELMVGTDDGVRSISQADDLGAARWRPAGLDGIWVFTLLEVDDGGLLAGTLGNGTFARSGHNTWEPSHHGLHHPNVYDLCLTGDGAVLAATGIPVEGGKSGGIFRSTDGGRSWTPTAHEPITVYRIVEDRGGRLFAGAQRCHVLVSDDRGSSWTTARPPVHDLKMYCLASDDEDRLYLAAGALLLRSDDGADTWEEVGEGLDGVTTYDLIARGGALIAATSAGMFRSEDRGDTWLPGRED